MARLGKKLRSLEGGRVAFMCPGCERTHALRVEGDKRPRWTYDGNADAPTFSPSVHSNPPGQWHDPSSPICHSWVRGGRIQFLPDSTHALAGQTVDLPDVPG